MLSSLFPPIKALILDLDGVIWKGDQAIGDLPRIFDRMRELNLRFTLATNNSTRSIDQYVDRMRQFGVEIIPEQVVNSAMATARRLASHFPQGGPVYIVGENGIHAAMAEYGFQHSENKPLAVIVGMDRGLTFEKLRKAALFIRSGAAFYGTNPDRTFPTPEGLIPGAGSVIALVQVATDVEPIFGGKPFPAMFEIALQRMGVTAQETLAVGDRLDTDILGGQNAGCRSAVVLSGVTSLEQAQTWRPTPDIIAPDLSTILGING